ncbi:PAS domain-containing protein [Hymenobacter sp. BRD67]|uniref:PAS domain-containing protein n=1 Tax=Hymenobacter sp. BRD67 TaxID=2675877 RepID=UPI0039773421
MVRSQQYVFEYANPRYLELFPDRELLGHSVLEIIPEAAEQGFIGLLDQVYLTGTSYYGKEVLLHIHRRDTGKTEEVYLDFTYQAFRENVQIVGISCFAFDVTELVRTRKKLETLTELLPPTAS